MGPISIIDSDNPSLRVFARAPSAWNDFPPYGLASRLCCLVLDSSLSQQGSPDPNSAFPSRGTLFVSSAPCVVLLRTDHFLAWQSLRWFDLLVVDDSLNYIRHVGTVIYSRPLK